MVSNERDTSTKAPRRFRPGRSGRTFRAVPPCQAAWSESGAVAVEYALCMLIAAAILMGVETEIFQPMAKDILKDFMGFISPPYP